ncbi:MAG: citramalate synthase, partial [Rickettsiales bacterium]|nr:citramalate synthase [Rickettsiales bacterium]
PGANPSDDEFFANLPDLKQSHITAFGMTRRPSTSVENDPGLHSLINSGAKHITIVGKSWDFHVDKALEIPRNDNLLMISESIAYIKSRNIEPMFDAEHFFDGYKANPEYAIECIKAAYEAGARWVILCDTNGGTLPHEIYDIISQITSHIPGDHLGIHCHNDTGNAVANSIEAVRAGVRQVQGTLNGIGERCGNANLISIIPNLMLKMGFDTGIDQEQLQHLVKLSRFLDDKLNKHPDQYMPYVGESAFAHKGGLHVSAIAKDSSSYEHIDPETVGNSRTILVSSQAGRSNILSRLKDTNFDISNVSKDQIQALVDKVKDKENEGYAYDTAEASFVLLAHSVLKPIPSFFQLESFRVIDERRWNAKRELVTVSEATTKITVGHEVVMSVAEGNGPVNALDKVLRKALSDTYPVLANIKLIDYKVRIVNMKKGTDAVIRVLIETKDDTNNRWCTVGVSTNVIDASYEALRDSILYKLLKHNT